MEEGKGSMYKCGICGLHYNEEKDAEECFKWCSVHDSCNLSIASRSVEALEKRKSTS